MAQGLPRLTFAAAPPAPAGTPDRSASGPQILIAGPP
jgi:hypothetical protein